MIKATQNIAGGLEEGLEGGIWGGVKGALIGYMTLPVIAALSVGALVGFGAAGPLVGALWGAVTLAATAVLGYPINKRVAKAGGLIGGVVGFTRGVDEPEPAPTLQLEAGQGLVVVGTPNASFATHENNSPLNEPESIAARSAAAPVSRVRTQQMEHAERIITTSPQHHLS